VETRKGVENLTRNSLLWSPKWFTERLSNTYMPQRWKLIKVWKIQQEMVDFIPLSSLLSRTFAYINSQRWKPGKVWKIQQAMVYSVQLSGLLSWTLAYM